MSEPFKPGDRVRVVRGCNSPPLVEGDCHLVTGLAEQAIAVYGAPGYWSENRFELVSPAKTYQDGLAEGKAALERVRIGVARCRQRAVVDRKIILISVDDAIAIIDAEIARADSEIKKP